MCRKYTEHKNPKVVGVFKDLTRRTAFDKQLLDTAFNIAKNPKCVGYQHGLTSMVYVLIKRLRMELLKVEICQTKN